MDWLQRHLILASGLLLFSTALLVGVVALTKIPLGQSLSLTNPHVEQFQDPYASASTPDFSNLPYTNPVQKISSTSDEVRTLPYRQIYSVPTDASPKTTDTLGEDLQSILNRLKRNEPVKMLTDSFSFDTFLPTGVSSIDDISAQQGQESGDKRALRTYANTVGGIIQGFEQIHMNQASVLKDFMEDRTNTSKAQAQIKLGNDYNELASAIGYVQEIPAPVRELHKNLIASYKDLGQKLSAVPQSEDLLSAIETYNTSAQHFAQTFVALALTFPAYGIQFSQSEAGSVFQFTNSKGL